ncbi:MAG: hypothetical protein ACI4F7_03410 [Acutalibacteraceae bacterium]
MFKRVGLFVLALITVFVFSSCGNSAKVSDNTAEKVYDEFINHLNGKDSYYTEKDIDGNGYDELIVKENTAVTVYSFNGDVYEIGSHDFLTATARLFYSENGRFPGIFCFTVSGGVNHYGYMTVKSNKLFLEELWEEDYSGITGNNTAIKEISSNKELIAESKKAYSDSLDIVFTSVNNNSADMLFNSFITGKTDALDKQGNLLKLKSLLNGNTAEYAFYDMNGDERPELLIKSNSALTVFWIENNCVTLWREDTCYSKPLNNSAILSQRHGGAPEHTDYSYSVLGYKGDELYRIEFSEYAESGQNGNKYFINGTEVSESVYDSLTAPLLNIGDNKINWISF